MTPKRGPRSTPKRRQSDIKIDINFDAKTKRAYQGLGFRHWVETPPREAPQEPWEGAQAARERPPGTHARGILVYIIHNIQYTGYLSIQYTGIQSTCIQYTGIQGTRCRYGKRVEGNGKRV